MMGTLRRVLLLAGGAVLIVVLGVQLPAVRNGLADNGVGRPPADTQAANAAPQTSFSPGLAPLFALPDDTHPIRAAAGPGFVAFLGTPRDERNLSLFFFDGRRIDRKPLPLPSAGVLAGLVVTADGLVWVAAGDGLVRVDVNRAVHRFALPPTRYDFPQGFKPADPSGLPPTESGQATAVALAGQKVLVGRLGFPEITVFDPATSTFSAVDVRAVGDVSAFARGPAGTNYFTVNRSARTGVLYDAIGSYDNTTGAVTALLQPARSIASNGSTVAFAGFGIGQIDQQGQIGRPPVRSDVYDQSRIGVRSDGSMVVRAAGGQPEMVVMDSRGRELRRVAYSAVTITDRRGATTLYASAPTFIVVDAEDSVWFALFGRPEVYRLR